MKKILFVFALTLLFALGASAQSYPTTIQVDPDSTTSYVETVDIFDTITGSTTVYIFDYDSIVSIDSVFGPHGFMGMDTTYLCTDTLEITDTNIVPIVGFHNYRAVAGSGWVFDHWMITVPYDDTDSVLIDTVLSYTEFLGDDLDDEFWMDWPGIPDSTDESLGMPIQITAYFTTITGISETRGNINTFNIYISPVSNKVVLYGDLNVVYVYDTAGRIVMKSDKPAINLSVDLGNQPNGVYIFRVINTIGQVGVSKIVKQ